MLDKGEYVRVLFMDLSKTFATIIQDLLLAKLRAFGLSNNALNLMYIYFKNKKLRTQINKNFSSEKNLLVGVAQGSINEPFYLIFS